MGYSLSNAMAYHPSCTVWVLIAGLLVNTTEGSYSTNGGGIWQYTHFKAHRVDFFPVIHSSYSNMIIGVVAVRPHLVGYPWSSCSAAARTAFDKWYVCLNSCDWSILLLEPVQTINSNGDVPSILLVSLGRCPPRVSLTTRMIM